MAKYFCNDSYCDSQYDVPLGVRKCDGILVAATIRILPKIHPENGRNKFHSLFSVQFNCRTHDGPWGLVCIVEHLPCRSNERRSLSVIVRRAHWCQPLWCVWHWTVDANGQRCRMFRPLDYVYNVRWVRTTLEIVRRRQHRIYCLAIGS